MAEEGSLRREQLTKLPSSSGERRFARERDFWRRFRRRRVGLVSLFVLLVVMIAAVVPGPLTTHDPNVVDATAPRSGPTWDHWLGTDSLGRDTYSRLVEGARTSVLVGLGSLLIGVGVGLPIGILAGWWGGRRDEFLMRLMDSLFAFPSLLLALLIITGLGPGLQNVTIAIGIPFIAVFARISRGSTLSVKEQEYVLAAIAIGASDRRIAARHILPNTLAPIIVQASLLFGIAIIVEAALSFLGLGTLPPDPSWGIMLSSAQRFLRDQPLLAIVPGTAISVTVLSFNLIGDVLRDLLDPRLRGSD
ncbi:MAG: ABC transporter permease [Chloroflexi bacterium]|nr:ABC transporter permease [Chloroflexota bacterium]MDA1147855.1 ABC transporter permease [Chloroflexota bacterium]